MRCIPILIGTVLSTSVFVASATAQQGDAAERRPTKPSADDLSIPSETNERVETDSENIFGFTEGTDTQKQGKREVSFGGVGRFGKRRFGRPQLPDTSAPEPSGLASDDDVPTAPRQVSVLPA